MSLFDRRCLLVVALLAGLTMAGCSFERPVVGDFVGSLDGTDAFVSVVAFPDGHVLAYICDGRTMAEWLRGQIVKTDVAVASGIGGTLLARLEGHRAEGSLQLPDGRVLRFTTALAEAEAGLYHARQTFNGVEYVGGWIVLPDGRQRGAVARRGSVVSSPSLAPGDSVSVTTVGTFVPKLVNPFIDPISGL
jgi:hypothetical protein